MILLLDARCYVISGVTLPFRLDADAADPKASLMRVGIACLSVRKYDTCSRGLGTQSQG